MNTKKVIILLMGLALLLSACSKSKTDAANMEQIYKEKGIPVKVEAIKPQTFVKELGYNTTLRGSKETPVYAMLSDQISEIKVGIGQYVKKDQVLISFPTNNPSASYHQAEAGYLLAKSTYNRMKNLFETGGISQQDLDQAETQYKVSSANWDAVQQAVKVRAPIDGIVTDIPVRLNQKINPGDLLCTVSQLSTMRSKVLVTEKDIMKIKKGLTVDFNWNDQTYQGRVVEVALSMNPDQQAFGVDIDIQNRDNQLKSGINGDIVIMSKTIPNAIVINRKFVQTIDNKSYVYVCENNQSIRKEIKVGDENNLEFYVTEGLKADDLLITEGYNLVEDGSKVNIVKE